MIEIATGACAAASNERIERMRTPLPRWLLALAMVLSAALPLAAQGKYNGPRPPKPDVPFLVHATNLVETEVLEAAQSTERNSTVYTVAGAASPVKTPVPEPIFLFQSEKLNPDRLSCYRMTVRGGNRTITFPARRGKDGPQPVYMMVTPLDRGLFRVEVNEPVEEGEYCLSPDGSNQVFCFSIY